MEAGRVIAEHINDDDGLYALVETLTEVTGLVLIGGMVGPVDAFSDPEDFVANLPDDPVWLEAVVDCIQRRLAASPVETNGPPEV